MDQAGLPGSKMIPAAHALSPLLALKLFGSARHSHVMSYVLDQGLALFSGLNAIPKRAFLTEYSCRIHPACHAKLMKLWFEAMETIGIDRGVSFDLDFHTIPIHGEDALVQKHYVFKRSRKQKGILTFLAQDAKTRVFCSDPQSYVSRLLLTIRSHRAHQTYIYNSAQIWALMAAVSRLLPLGSLRSHAYRMLLGLLYSTGIRIGEAMALNLQDVHPKSV